MKFRFLPFALSVVFCCLFMSPGTAQMRVPQTVGFAPMQDPWPSARERWLDINNNPYNAWLTNGQPNGVFSYGNAQVQLTFDRAPGVPYFVGRIRGRGLKPNFSYQLKLVGKPERGTRGWGALGDDLSNERIGLTGRWWCDSSHASQTNFDDAHYYRYYKYAPPGSEHNIYGYQYMGEFVTDALGNADVAFSGQYSYHITWASWQGGIRDTLFGTLPVQGGALSDGSFYGYGSNISQDDVTLYYEYEASRPNPVQLARGSYKGRFVLTEETFHNTSFLGGYWKGVLATEDVTPGQPDTVATNDVNFVIGANAPQLSAITPSFAADASQSTRTFSTTYRDPDNDLHSVQLRVGNGANSLTCLYSLLSRKLFVRSGSGAWQGGATPGSPIELNTPSGTLLCAATQVNAISSGVQVLWRIQAPSAWDNSTQALSTYATDATGLSSGWNKSAWWKLGANQAPVNVSLSPSQSSSAVGNLHRLTSVHSDPNGADDIPFVMLNVESASSGAKLRAYYNARRNLLYLYKDDGVTLEGGFAPGSNHVIANSQGSLDCAATTVAARGNSIVINWALSAESAMLGSQQVSLFVRDWQGAFDGFETFGTWAIRP